MSNQHCCRTSSSGLFWECFVRELTISVNSLRHFNWKVNTDTAGSHLGICKETVSLLLISPALLPHVLWPSKDNWSVSKFYQFSLADAGCDFDTTL